MHPAIVYGEGVRQLLVIEDGHEYEEFARTFLSEYVVRAAHSAGEALALLSEQPCDAMLVDLRFERTRASDLVGDIEATARRRFGGDTHRAIRHLKEQQGTLVLAALRTEGHAQRAVFVHDFPPRRLANLRRLYGAVSAVGKFHAEAIRAALLEPS